MIEYREEVPARGEERGKAHRHPECACHGVAYGDCQCYDDGTVVYAEIQSRDHVTGNRGSVRC